MKTTKDHTQLESSAIQHESSGSILDQDFLTKLDRPWKILKNGTKLGIGGIKRFSAILLLSVLINFLLWGFAIYKATTGSFSWGVIGVLLLLIVLGCAFTLWTGYRSYRYVFMNVLAKIYEKTHDYRQRMCAQAVTRTKELFSGEQQVTTAKLKAAVDWGNSAYGFYGQIPVFFQSGITQLLNRSPITAFLLSMKEDIKARETKVATDKLHGQLNNFIRTSFFSTNNTRWLLWLIPLHVLVMLTLTLYGLGSLPVN